MRRYKTGNNFCAAAISWNCIHTYICTYTCTLVHMFISMHIRTWQGTSCVLLQYTEIVYTHIYMYGFICVCIYMHDKEHVLCHCDILKLYTHTYMCMDLYICKFIYMHDKEHVLCGCNILRLCSNLFVCMDVRIYTYVFAGISRD